MRSIVLSVLVCVLTAVAAPAQIIVAGGAAPIGIPAGAAIWYGAAEPANTVGTDGDYYLNTTSYCLYGPKASGAWPSPCVSSVRQLGYVAENVDNKGVAGGYAPLDANGLVPAANLPPTSGINGTSMPGNNASDQTVITTAPSVGTWTSLPSCPDTGGNHLNYSLVTHGFLCGNTGGTTGSVDFGGVGSGTNANGLLISGTLSYTGGGLVNANQLGGVSLSSLPTGLLKVAGGTGIPGVAGASDITNALGFNPENAANRNAANGYAPLDANGLVPRANLPATTAINGTSVPSNNSSDQTVVTTAPSVGSWTALPSCPDTGGNHLNYSAATHSFLCGNTGGTSGSVQFDSVGSGTNPGALLVSGSLGYTGGGQINANQLGGVSLQSLATGMLKNTTGSGAASIASSADVTNTLGFVPENPANKGAANGYAPLNSSGLLPDANLPADAVTSTTLGNSTLSGALVSLNTTSDVNAGGNLNATGSVVASSLGTSVASGTYQSSSGTTWGTGTCTLTVTGGGGSGAVFTITTSGSAPSVGASLALSTAGAGYSTNPTAASPSGSCTGGAVTIATLLTNGCVHMQDGAGHDMGLCAPPQGTNALVNLWSTPGSSGQVAASDGTNDLIWMTPTSTSTAGALVKRDANGNFSAGTITANLTGNVNGTAIPSSTSFATVATSGNAGDLSGTLHAAQLPPPVAGGRAGVVAVLGAPTGNIGNTATQVIGYTVPAATIATGTTYTFEAWGVESTSTSPGNDTFSIEIGSTSLSGNMMVQAVPAAAANATAAPIWVKGTITVFSSTVSGAMTVCASTSGALSGTCKVAIQNSATINAAQSNVIELVYQSGASSSTINFSLAKITLDKP